MDNKIFNYFANLIYKNIGIIYTENKIKIIENIRQSLNHNGYIILGAGESMLSLNKELLSKVYNGSVFYQHTNEKKGSIKSFFLLK